MGRSKAALMIRDETMVARQVRLLRRVCPRVAVVGPPGGLPRLEVPVIADEIPGRGPLAGLSTALDHCPAEFALVLSCDLPFMMPEFLRFLARRARGSCADAVVPQSREGWIQPLAAVYRRRLRTLLRVRLGHGENKVRDFLASIRMEVVPWPEISAAGFRPLIFVNMNTPEDYAEAVRRTEAYGIKSRA